MRLGSFLLSFTSLFPLAACGQSDDTPNYGPGGAPSGGANVAGAAGPGTSGGANSLAGSGGALVSGQGGGGGAALPSGGTPGAAGTLATGGSAGNGTAGTAGGGVARPACKMGAPAPASGGANFPFPQKRFSGSCMYPTTCSDLDVTAGWQHYKTRMIVDGGDGSLRVQRPEFDNDTVSEGMAYGLLFAVYMNDKDTFDKLWKYVTKYFDDKGLMHWKIASGGNVTGTGSATDSDEDMAFALVMADKQWAGYTDTAKDFLGKVAEHDFHDDGTIRGGDGYDPVNPSYLAPAFYRTFAAYTGDARWTTILDKSYEILNGAANGTTGLVPDWSSGRDGPTYSYDAARTPYRIALDACWNGEPRAKAYAEKVGNFFAGVTVPNIRDGFTLDGQIIMGKEHGEHLNSTFVATAGVAGMVANQSKLIDDAYAFVAKDLNEGTENYYNMSWALFAAMLMTGNFADLTKQ